MINIAVTLLGKNHQSIEVNDRALSFRSYTFSDLCKKFGQTKKVIESFDRHSFRFAVLAQPYLNELYSLSRELLERDLDKIDLNSIDDAAKMLCDLFPQHWNDYASWQISLYLEQCARSIFVKTGLPSSNVTPNMVKLQALVGKMLWFNEDRYFSDGRKLILDASDSFVRHIASDKAFGAPWIITEAIDTIHYEGASIIKHKEAFISYASDCSKNGSQDTYIMSLQCLACAEMRAGEFDAASEHISIAKQHVDALDQNNDSIKYRLSYIYTIKAEIERRRCNLLKALDYYNKTRQLFPLSDLVLEGYVCWRVFEIEENLRLPNENKFYLLMHAVNRLNGNPLSYCFFDANEVRSAINMTLVKRNIRNMSV